MLDALDERNIARTIPRTESGVKAGVVVLIGSENRDDVLREFSLVIGRYGGNRWPERHARDHRTGRGYRTHVPSVTCDTCRQL